MWNLKNNTSESESCSVVFDSLQLHGLYSPQNSPGQNTGASSLSLLQRISPTQESNRGLLYCGWILYQLSYQGSPQATIHKADKQQGFTVQHRELHPTSPNNLQRKKDYLEKRLSQRRPTRYTAPLKLMRYCKSTVLQKKFFLKQSCFFSLYLPEPTTLCVCV